jgi:hypothetical protein
MAKLEKMIQYFSLELQSDLNTPKKLWPILTSGRCLKGHFFGMKVQKPNQVFITLFNVLTMFHGS